MRSAAALLIVAVFLACTNAFENAKMRARTQKVKEAASYLRVPNYSVDEQRCAACESVAQSIEQRMRLDVHKGGYVEQVALLMSACDGIDDKFLPAELADPQATNTDSSPKVLHFSPGGASATRDQRISVGLGEYCTTLVEEFEDELVDMIASAKPIGDEMSSALGMPKGNMRYELKEQTCVERTRSCTNEALNRISSARMGLLKDMDKDTQAKLVEMLSKQIPGLEAAKAAKAEAELSKPPASSTSDKEGGKKWKGKAKKPPKKATTSGGLPSNPLEAFEWLRETTAQTPMAILASVTATTAVVYVGGMVARVW